MFWMISYSMQPLSDKKNSKYLQNRIQEVRFTYPTRKKANLFFFTEIEKNKKALQLWRFWSKNISNVICKLDRQKPNPQIFLQSDNCFYFYFIFKGFLSHKIFQKCRSKKSVPDISPIFDFSDKIGKSDPKKPNLEVFLQSEHFFYIF